MIFKGKKINFEKRGEERRGSEKTKEEAN